MRHQIESDAWWVTLVAAWLMVVGAGGGCASSDAVAAHTSREPAFKQAPGMYGGGQAQADDAFIDRVAAEGDGPARRALANRSGGAVQEKRPDTSQKTAERKLIRNAWVTLEVRDEDDFPGTVDQLGQIAEAFDGYVQSESSNGATLMVPTERLEEALEQVSGLGEITYRNISVSDVTSRYVDLRIRIENLEKMRVRLTELVNQSTSVSEVLNQLA